MNLKEVGRKIKEQRIYKGLTQEQLAEAVEITSTYLSGIENGNKIASLKKMVAIANSLDMSLDFMFLEDMSSIDEDTNIDANMNEFKFMLKELDDKELISDFVCYCRVLSKEIANRKK